VVVQILVAQAQGEDALLEQLLDRELDPFRVAKVLEAGGEPVDDPGLRFHLPQQQRPGIRGDRPTVKSGGDFSRAKGLEIERPLITLCGHEAASLLLA
jgi:hypothetical protein